MNPIITEKNLELFSKEIWKDFRRLEVVTQGNKNVIRRYSDHHTSIAFEVWYIKQLRGKVQFQIPKIIEHNKNAITFEYIRGTRAFNLLSDLKSLYQSETDRRYLSTGRDLINLLQEDLTEFQAKSRFPFNKEFESVVYPAHQKLETIYSMLGDLLDFDYCYEDLQKIGDIYLKEATVPFRDATTKNVILNIPALYQANFRSYQDRIDALNQMVHSGELSHFFERSHIYHIDFSGCQFSCPQQDDWIAIREHEGSSWLNLNPKIDFDLLSDEELCVIFVRFTRFGGRKLLYRLLNYQGYKVRFCFDQELYYFSVLKQVCQVLLNRGFLTDKSWYQLMAQLEEATGFTPQTDHFLSWKTEKDLSHYYSDVFPD